MLSLLCAQTTWMQKMFALVQEAKRKDIECAFGILQAYLYVLTSGCRLYECLLHLHDMIIAYNIKIGLHSTCIKELE